MHQTTGVLLINLGTPDAPTTPAVRRYLREFLMDKRVIDLPYFIRALLVYGLILPFRPKKTAKAYQAIWTGAGSPLLYWSLAAQEALAEKLGSTYQVVLGMRYGNPSISSALHALKDCQKIIVIPLYPQYASSTTGSSMEAVMDVLKHWDALPELHILKDFYQDSDFIRAQAERIEPFIENHEHIVFSYHGLPERHLERLGCKPVCQGACPNNALQLPVCYKAQCYKTTLAIADMLELTPNKYTVAFQSRLGKTPWIRPYTDELLEKLAARGIRKLAIACPSFVTDCLETLEEIGMREREHWLALGGETLDVIPCLNADHRWIQTLATWVENANKANPNEGLV